MVRFRFLFEKTKVEQLLEAKVRRALYRIGAYGRRVMRSLFRTSKKVSDVGNPPRSHGKRVLKSNTLFAVSLRAVKSVAVGPRILPGQSRNVRSSMPAPERLDRGGSATIKNKNGKRRRVRYRHRPFTRRSYERTAPKLADFMQR